MIRERGTRQRVQSSTGHVRFDLTVPCRSIELAEPRAEAGELTLGQPAHLLLDLLDVGHGLSIEDIPKITDASCMRLPRTRLR